MLFKLKLLVNSSKQQFFRYFITGVSGFVLDIITLYIFRELLGFDPVYSVALNQIIMIAYLFTLNKVYSFRVNGHTKTQLMKFVTVMGFNYVVAVVWMWFWNERLALEYVYTIRVVNIVLSVSWNFLLYKFWVYKN